MSTNINKERNLQKSILDIKRKYGKNAILKGMNFLEFITKLDRVVKNSLTIAIGGEVKYNTGKYLAEMNDNELNFAIDTLSDVAERAFGSSIRNTFKGLNPRDFSDYRTKIEVIAKKTDRLFKLMVRYFSDEEIIKIMMGW